MNNSELSNAGLLDEGVSNLINENLLSGLTENTSLLNANGNYSNLINESLLNGLTENTSLLNASGEEFSYASAGKDLAALSGCKKPKSPLLGIFTGGLSNINYKKKKKAYEECISNYKANLESQRKEAAESKQKTAEIEAKLEQAKKELESAKSDNVDSSAKRQDSGDNKILGMPKGVAIGLGVAVLAVGGFFLYKKFKK